MRWLVLCSLIFACFSSVLNAKIYEYNQLLSAPKGLAKDYYIYRFATEKKPSKEQLKALQPQIFRYSGKIKKKFDSLVGTLKLPKECEGDFFTATASCQKEMLSKKFIESLGLEQRAQLVNFLKGKDNDMWVLASSFESSDPLKYIIEKGSLWAYYRYLGASVNLAKEFSKYKPSKAMWQNLGKSRKFIALLNQAVVDDNNPALKKWLYELNPNEPMGEAAFYAGLNALLMEDEKKALEFFKTAAKTANSAMNKDAAMFWSYLISSDKNTLNTLSNSKNINMYSLYAKELTGNNKVEVIIPKPSRQGLNGYDITDPFTWQRTKDAINKLASKDLARFALKFYTKSTIGEFSFLMEKAYKGARNYFPLPFMELIGTNDTARKALILALARQESRFVPASVSTSYALGMMQFMPFLANDIGHKKLQIPGFEEDDMFKPRVAYEFANYHLNYLEKYIQNPIFIAYAYNGGLGFTKKMILGGKLFTKSGKLAKYEPFLSMERVPLLESRDYAKKVLANYVIYSSILGSNIKISQFFESLAIPGASESFRR